MTILMSKMIKIQFCLSAIIQSKRKRRMEMNKVIIIARFVLWIFKATTNWNFTEETHPSRLNNVLCDVCEKVFSSIGIRNSHMKTVHSVAKPYPCDQCDKSFNTAGIRKAHIRNRHSEDGALQRICEECGKMFRHAGSLNIHVEHVHKSWQPSWGPQCGKPVRHLRNYVKRKHSTIRKYGCEDCGKMFKTKSDLTRHAKSHLPGDINLLLNEKQREKNQCYDCGRGFIDSTKLKRHVAIKHTGIRSFFCKECPASYFRSDHLKNHVASNHHKQRIINLFWVLRKEKKVSVFNIWMVNFVNSLIFSDVVKSLTAALSRYTHNVVKVVSTSTPDRREPEYVVYDTLSVATLNVYRVKPAVWDLSLSATIKCYLALVLIFSYSLW